MPDYQTLLKKICLTFTCLRDICKVAQKLLLEIY